MFKLKFILVIFSYQPILIIFFITLIILKFLNFFKPPPVIKGVLTIFLILLLNLLSLTLLSKTNFLSNYLFYEKMILILFFMFKFLNLPTIKHILYDLPILNSYHLPLVFHLIHFLFFIII